MALFAFSSRLGKKCGYYGRCQCQGQDQNGQEGNWQEGSPQEDGPARAVYLLQRKDEKLGKNLARTTGWIRRLTLRRAGVKMLSDLSYEKIDDFGLHIIHRGVSETLAVDHVIICAGQESEDYLYKKLREIGQPVHVIGGAKKAAELDAETAIREGMVLAYKF